MTSASFAKMIPATVALTALLHAGAAHAQTLEEWKKQQEVDFKRFKETGSVATPTNKVTRTPDRPKPPAETTRTVPPPTPPPAETTKPVPPPAQPPAQPPAPPPQPPIATQTNAPAETTQTNAVPEGPATAPADIEDRAPAKWLIMVYQAGDNNLDSAALDDVKEMEKVGSSASLKLVVLMDRAEGMPWSSARRFLVRKPSEQGGKHSWDPSLSTCKDLGELNMGNPDTLAGFVDWSLKNHPAANTMLVLWNHGGGWRSAMQKAVSRTTKAPGDAVPMSGAVISRGIAWDDTNNGDFLESREVRAALARFPKLSIIGADACLMAMLECAYEWHELADYYVASEDSEPNEGWPYDRILSAIAAKPAIKPADLAGHIVKVYGEFYAARRQPVTQSAVRMDRIAAVAQAVDAMAGELLASRQLPDDLFDVPSYPPGQGTDFDSLDLGGILDRAARASQATPAARTAAGEAQKRLAEAVIANYSDKSLGGQGLTIYGGRSVEMPDYRPDIIRFTADTRWDEFLKAYAGRERSAPAANTPNRWAVLIGVADYADTKVPDLVYPKADVEAMRDTLINHAGYASNHVITLVNEQATTEKVRSVLGTDLPRQAGSNDLVMIYFSGHGASEASSRDGSDDGTAKYMLLANSKLDDLYGTALPMSELSRIFGRIRADKVILFMDACYSGAAGAKGVMRTSMRSAMTDDYLNRLAASQGTVVITASRASEVSLESARLKHGVFTHYLIETFKGLADANGDGTVTLTEAFQFLASNVVKESRSLGSVQQPVMKGEVTGDFPLASAPKDKSP